jgi:proteasome accessory factor A
VALLDLQYHDINRDRGLFYRCRTAAWSSGCATTRRSTRRHDQPPADHPGPPARRVHPRAKERKRDYTVDWVHLKLNDQAQRTVLCKDPFKAHDERVEKLIASL